MFNIHYKENIGQATEIILEEAKTIDGILGDPEPSVRLNELGDSQVGLESRFWIKGPDRSEFVNTRSDYARAVKERFDEEQIEIPFPQRDLSGEVVLSDSDSAPAEQAPDP